MTSVFPASSWEKTNMPDPTPSGQHQKYCYYLGMLGSFTQAIHQLYQEGVWERETSWCKMGANQSHKRMERFIEVANFDFREQVEEVNNNNSGMQKHYKTYQDSNRKSFVCRGNHWLWVRTESCHNKDIFLWYPHHLVNTNGFPIFYIENPNLDY